MILGEQLEGQVSPAVRFSHGAFIHPTELLSIRLGTLGEGGMSLTADSLW
jgi:hypothetical protein